MTPPVSPRVIGVAVGPLFSEGRKNSFKIAILQTHPPGNTGHPDWQVAKQNATETSVSPTSTLMLLPILNNRAPHSRKRTPPAALFFQVPGVTLRTSNVPS